MTEEEIAIACNWSDYRKNYGVSSAAMAEAHKAFKAGWAAATGTLDVGGILR